MLVTTIYPNPATAPIPLNEDKHTLGYINLSAQIAVAFAFGNQIPEEKKAELLQASSPMPFSAPADIDVVLGEGSVQTDCVSAPTQYHSVSYVLSNCPPSIMCLLNFYPGNLLPEDIAKKGYDDAFAKYSLRVVEGAFGGDGNERAMPIYCSATVEGQPVTAYGALIAIPERDDIPTTTATDAESEPAAEQATESTTH